MIPKNKFFLLIFFFIVFSTYNLNEQKRNFIGIFPIKKIIIEQTSAFNLVKIKSELESLKNTSLFFLKEKKITKIIDKYDFISGIQLKKKYPNTLKILISEKKPVASIKIDGKNFFYLTENGDKIIYVQLKIYENLPVIIGNYKDFSFFFKNLKKSNFKINNIKAFYYFDIGRWDILLKDEITIKLPTTNYQKILLEVDSLLQDDNFSEYKILDYRIKDQLILQ